VQLAAIFLSWQRQKKIERWYLFAPYTVAVNLCDATMTPWKATARYKNYLGTSIVCNSCAITSSGVSPSISRSGVNIIR
jgi:hypothetical protein